MNWRRGVSIDICFNVRNSLEIILFSDSEKQFLQPVAYAKKCQPPYFLDVERQRLLLGASTKNTIRIVVDKSGYITDWKALGLSALLHIKTWHRIKS